MKHYGTEHKRLIGEWCVRIKYHKIDIEGNRHTNRGIIYPHMVIQWINGENCQIIGMDNSYGLTKAVLAYIHDYIRKHHRALPNEDKYVRAIQAAFGTQRI